MQLFGFDIVWPGTQTQAVSIVPKAMPQSIESARFPQQILWPNSIIREPYAGAWQQNVIEASPTSIMAFSATFACVTGIASDIGKMRLKLCRNVDGVWQEILEGQPTWLKVLRKPNPYQTRIKFIEAWIASKLLHGNAYILKRREPIRRLVTELYVLDPSRVRVLVAENGDVYYELSRDDLAGVQDEGNGKFTVPASEIIHDTMVCLWHPLVGVSPLYACMASANMGNKIQQNSTIFFANMSRPSGMLSSPAHIDNDTADRLKKYWEENFSGGNIGRVAVAGDGLKYEQFTIPAETSQLIEQLKWTVEDVARAFRYPMWKLGGPVPPYSAGPEAVTVQYLNDCLHPLIESLELCLDEGLELPAGIGTELDLETLLRMDTNALFTTNNLGVGGGWMKPNEARYRANLPPAKGGDSPMIQQQNFSLEALAKRDADEPFAKPAPAPPPDPDEEDPEEDDEEEPTPPPPPPPEKSAATVQQKHLLYRAALRGMVLHP